VADLSKHLKREEPPGWLIWVAQDRLRPWSGTRRMTHNKVWPRSPALKLLTPREGGGRAARL
jgi:hypothetical protein